MNISAKTKYAAIAMLELASHYGEAELLRTCAIAEANNIPPQFLVQILIQLKGAGLVSSTRGAAGGYRLARAPEQITLGEVMTLIEGPRDCLAEEESQTGVKRVLLSAWRSIDNLEREMLDQLTFAKLVEHLHGVAEPMYYI